MNWHHVVLRVGVALASWLVTALLGMYTTYCLSLLSRGHVVKGLAGVLFWPTVNIVFLLMLQALYRETTRPYPPKKE